MMDFPRFFGFAEQPDCDVPQLRQRQRGWGWTGFAEDAEYEYYHTWLVGYLAGIADRPVPACQAELCAQLETMALESWVDWLGRGAFRHLLDYEELAGYLRAGLGFAAAEKDRRARWKARSLLHGIDKTGPFAELTPAHWDEARREFAEQSALPGRDFGLDAGYRLPLARALRQVQRSEDKFRLLSRFNNAFDEAESDLKGDRLF